jgi:hypothetical protein
MRVIAGHAAQTFKDRGKIRAAIEQLKAPVAVEPMAMPPTPTETDKMIFSIEYQAYAKQKRTLQQAVEALYSIVWGRCTDVMRQRLEALPGHGNTAVRLDGVKSSRK